MEFEYTRPWMYDKQLDAIFCDERYAIVEASTKAGKTLSSLAWLFEQAIFSKPNRHYWWVAPVLSQSEIAFNRMYQTVSAGGLDDFFKINKTKMTLILPNDVVLEFKSAEYPDRLYGEDVYGAVIDEASRVRRESFWAVRSTLTQTRGKLRIIGNVKGRKNWFYDLAREARTGDNAAMHYAKITAYDAAAAGVFPLDEIEDARAILPDAIFRELYLAEPSADGGNPFGTDKIAACAVAGLSGNPPAVWGWDIGSRVDFTAGIALDADGNVCRIEHFKGDLNIVTDKIQAATARIPALIDRTGVGLGPVDTLQMRVPGVFEDFNFSSQSKQSLMEGLALAIAGRAVTFPNGDLRDELDVFEYEYTRTGIRYSAPSGMHDDLVVALALAWQKYTHLRPSGVVMDNAEPDDDLDPFLTDDLGAALGYPSTRRPVQKTDPAILRQFSRAFPQRPAAPSAPEPDFATALIPARARRTFPGE